MSANGLQLLKEWEGCKLKKYRCSAGKWTIGVGHVLTREEQIGGKYDNGITTTEAMDLLAKDLGPAEKCVNDAVKVDLHQHEFDALVSFVFNVGCGAFFKSTLLKRVNERKYIDVPQEFRKWVYASGKRILGLANRREKEIALWQGRL